MTRAAMRRAILNLGLAALVASAASVTAPTLGHATPINYTVSGTAVLNGHTETITGSFTFDTATDQESNASITFSGGAAPVDGTYTQITPIFTNSLAIFALTSPTANIELDFVSPLNVSPDALADVSYFSNSTGTFLDRSPTGSATAVPEPSSIALLATGLLGLGLMLYRRRAS